MKPHALIDAAFWSLLFVKWGLWRLDAREQFYRELPRTWIDFEVGK